MSFRFLSFLLVATPVIMRAQVATRPDSVKQRNDSLMHTAMHMQAITVTAGAPPPVRIIRINPSVIADPTLPFITEWVYEAGVHVDREHFSGSATLFRTDVSNEQTFDPIHLTSVSGGRSRRQGLELSITAPLGEYARLNGSWTLTDAKYLDQTTPDGDDLAGLRVANTAKYVGSAAIDIGKVSDAWSVRISGNVVGAYTPFDEPTVELPAYGLLHVSSRLLVGGRTTLRLGLRNLFDTKYPELRAGGFVSPGQPRSVYGAVSYIL